MPDQEGVNLLITWGLAVGTWLLVALITILILGRVSKVNDDVKRIKRGDHD